MTQSPKPSVAVIGSSDLQRDDPRYRTAVQMGEALVAQGYRLVCGGRAGVMEAACRGARNADSHRPGDIIGILPGESPCAANKYVDIAIPTDLGHARNFIVAQSPALIAIGGGAGTLSEICLGWIADRLIIAFEVEGWSGRLAGSRLDSRTRLSGSDVDDRIVAVQSVNQAIDRLEKLLDLYRSPPGEP